jgi:hypothetical protein
MIRVCLYVYIHKVCLVSENMYICLYIYIYIYIEGDTQ